MKNIIYVVTSGEYSAYGIEAVFDSKDLAKKFIDAFGNNYEEFMIEEYELNPHSKQLKSGRKPFVVTMGKNGDCYDVHQTTHSYEFSEEDEMVGNYMYCYMFAKDEKHAIKIANEKRTQLIVMDNWQEDKE